MSELFAKIMKLKYLVITDQKQTYEKINMN